MTRSMMTVMSSLCVALLSAPAPAQDDWAVSQPTKDVKFEVDDATADFAYLLLSLSSIVRPLGADWILADPLVMRMLKKGDGSGFEADLHVPDIMPSILLIHWQAVTLDATALRLRVEPVMDFLWPADSEKKDSDGSDSTGAGGAAPAIQLIIDDSDKDGRSDTLIARFEAPTDGYDLTTVRVEDNADETLIYLWQKLPGAGEGTHDVIETHSAKAPLRKDAKVVRVLRATGTSSKPSSEVAWQEIGKFQLR